MEKRHDKKNNRFYLGNNGSTLIVVMVGVCFLTVLGTIIVAVSVANLQMKHQEYIAKGNFYTDEKILADIYNGIGMVATEELSQAYTEIMANSGTDGAKYQTQEAAFNAFSRQFVNGLISTYGEDGDPGDPEDETTELLRAYIAVDGGGDPEIKLEKFRRIEVVNIKNERLGGNPIDPSTIPYQYVFRDLVVTYRETDSAGRETGYESTITADIVVEVPYISFFQDFTRILDYVMVGNKGIYFKGGTKRTVIGSVYAGINVKEPTPDLEYYRGVGPLSEAEEIAGGGLNFAGADVDFYSKRVVTKGDMNVWGSQVTFNNDRSGAGDVEVWVESIRTVKNKLESSAAAAEASTVDFKANQSVRVYAAGDLELNEDYSRVNLGDSYFGYNAGRAFYKDDADKEIYYRTWEEKSPFAQNNYKASSSETDYNDINHAQNSSVILNGIGTKVNLPQDMLINGMAYIDMSPGVITGITPDSLGEYSTGESIAVKSNQFIYLAPSAYLFQTNPVKVINPADPSLLAENVWNEGKEIDFFAQNSGLLDESPIIAHDVKEASGTYRYYFLKFRDASASTKYVETILNAGDPDAPIPPEYGNEYEDDEIAEIRSIRKSAIDRAAKAGYEITEVSRIYYSPPGAVLNTDGVLGVTKMEEANLFGGDVERAGEKASALEEELFFRYIRLYQTLEPWEGVWNSEEPPKLSAEDQPGTYGALLNPDTPDKGRQLQLPAGKYVDFDKITGAVATEVVNGTINGYQDSHYKSIISKKPVEVSTDFNGIILCTGDVTVKSGVSVSGLIVALGKIYVEGGGSIISDRGAVQAILDEEMRREGERPVGSSPNTQFAVNYLKDITVDYTGDNSGRVGSTDYTEFMSYDNWRKGE